MGTGYLLDTNIVIYYLEGVLTKSGKEFIKGALVDGGRISIISKIELLAWRPPQGADISKIITFLSQARIHNLNDETADITIEVKRSLATRPISLPLKNYKSSILFSYNVKNQKTTGRQPRRDRHACDAQRKGNGNQNRSGIQRS